ncbi:hypothetical protein ACMXYV_08600 [Neptuniibacter sp. SY11_33]|uniref:hypothetical protein n=1 Tax=Neptuniibacter sp. SY11_33 TaxID=3398215 RepID=UPI0039F52DFD
MTPDEFVNEFKELRDSVQMEYFSSNSEISRLKQLEDSGLNSEQIALVKSIVGDALTDSLYTVLLGLDGCASISKYQETYKLFSESGEELTGEIESVAWEQFHG